MLELELLVRVYVPLAKCLFDHFDGQRTIMHERLTMVACIIFASIRVNYQTESTIMQI